MVGLVVPEFRPRNQRGRRLPLERKGVRLERLGQSPRTTWNSCQRTGIVSSVEIDVTGACACATRILEEFGPGIEGPLIIEVMIEIGNHRVPAGVVASRSAGIKASPGLVPVVGLHDEGVVVGQLAGHDVIKHEPLAVGIAPIPNRQTDWCRPGGGTWSTSVYTHSASTI